MNLFIFDQVICIALIHLLIYSPLRLIFEILFAALGLSIMDIAKI